MKYRMGTALLSLAGMLVSAYLWMYKHGYIGSLVCGTGGCATVQFSPYSKFLGVDVALLGFVAVGAQSPAATPAGAAQKPAAPRAATIPRTSDGQVSSRVMKAARFDATTTTSSRAIAEAG